MNDIFSSELWEQNEIYADCAHQFIVTRKGYSRSESNLTLLRVILNLNDIFGEKEKSLVLLDSVYPATLRNEFLQVLEHKNEYGTIFEQIINKQYKVLNQKKDHYLYV